MNNNRYPSTVFAEDLEMNNQMCKERKFFEKHSSRVKKDKRHAEEKKMLSSKVTALKTELERQKALNKTQTNEPSVNIMPSTMRIIRPESLIKKVNPLKTGYNETSGTYPQQVQANPYQDNMVTPSVIPYNPYQPQMWSIPPPGYPIKPISKETLTNAELSKNPTRHVYEKKLEYWWEMVKDLKPATTKNPVKILARSPTDRLVFRFRIHRKGVVEVRLNNAWHIVRGAADIKA